MLTVLRVPIILLAVLVLVPGFAQLEDITEKSVEVGTIYADDGGFVTVAASRAARRVEVSSRTDKYNPRALGFFQEAQITEAIEAISQILTNPDRKWTYSTDEKLAPDAPASDRCILGCISIFWFPLPHEGVALGIHSHGRIDHTAVWTGSGRTVIKFGAMPVPPDLDHEAGVPIIIGRKVLPQFKSMLEAAEKLAFGPIT
jgi:hypothetical protein